MSQQMNITLAGYVAFSDSAIEGNWTLTDLHLQQLYYNKYKITHKDT